MKNKFVLGGYLTPKLNKLIMELKIAFLIVMASVTTVFAADTYSQVAKVSLDIENRSLELVMDEIEKQSEFYFIFNQKQIDVNRVVSIKEKDELITDILPALFKGTNVNYLVIDRKILLTTDDLVDNSIMSIAAELGAQQQRVITGTVTDEFGETLPGVSVTVSGTTRGTSTAAEGSYSILVSRGEELGFSFVGMEPVKVIVEDQTTIDVTMDYIIEALEDVIVVGYGVQKKVSLTGSVDQIGGDELVKGMPNTIDQALQGKAVGLTVLDQGGGPGRANTVIRVRGLTTIGGNEPLVLVDGIEQRYSDINPNDIESISVLKDASSTAIYGSRAANGVILITTKRAKEGEISVNYNFAYGLQKSTNSPESIELEDYFKMQTIAYDNVGLTPKFDEQEIEEYLDGVRNDRLTYPLLSDWFNIVLHTAPVVNHSLVVSGGKDELKGRFSLRHKNQDGIIPNANAKITEVRVNTDFNFSPSMTFTSDLYYQHKDYVAPVMEGWVLHTLLHRSLFTVPKYPDGTYGLSSQGDNPLMWAEIGGLSKRLDNSFFGNIKGEWNILENLSLTSQFAARMMNDRIKDYNNAFEIRDYYDPTKVLKTRPINRLNEELTNEMEYTLNVLLNYSINIMDHDLQALLGYSQIENNGNNLFAYRQGFYNNEVQSIDQGTDDGTKDNGGSQYAWGLRSYFGRLNYSFKDKYLFELNSRYDGSSRFTGKNKYSFFPSFSIGWRLSEEKFWTSLEDLISEFKVRGSWGQTGNQAVALYSYFSTLDLVDYSFSGIPVQGYVQEKLSNEDITWETTTQADVGVDAVFLNEKITLTADFYKKRTEGILLVLPIPEVLGLEPAPQNAGIVENTGFEMSLGVRHYNYVRDFNINANVFFTINNNEVVDLAGTGPYITGTGKNPQYITGVGYPINSFWGYKTDGLWQESDDIENSTTLYPNTKPGDVKYVDVNEDGMITPDDEIYLGNTFPKYTFGSNINIGYKNFSLAIFMQGAADVHTRPIGSFVEMGNMEAFIPSYFADNYWTPENPDAEFPRPTKYDLRNCQNIDRWVIDASYLRVKNIQLMYQMPEKFLNKFSIKEMNIYISGTNLFTLSKLTKWNMDPELLRGYLDYYPQVSLYTIGANVSF